MATPKDMTAILLQGFVSPAFLRENRDPEK
jgi:hypothetical protein